MRGIGGLAHSTIAAGLIIFGSIVPASADTITLTGATSGDMSTATLVAEFNAQTNTFTFTVTNTSHITSPGSTSTLTAIGYDLPPLGNGSSSGLNGFTGMQAPSLSSNFTFSDAALGPVPGFSSAILDFGFLTGASGSFAGGSIVDGLLPGESASFTVSGAGFAGYTESELIHNVFARYQTGGTTGFGDVAVPEGLLAPEPSTVMLLGLGVLAVRARRRWGRIA